MIQRFPEIDRAVNIPYSGRSELEIVRVLGNTHYEHLEQLLILLNKHLPSSGTIGKRVVQATLLDRPCVFPHRDQAPHIREVMGVFNA
ncbi:MAG: hypothetical protein OXG87_04360 [Gemmatimonadetes bacterium]|nr:hypothetical protein [Gemmatimonadota bacterium]